MNEIKEPRSVRRNLSKLVVPIFIETLLIMMLGAVDTIMLSQYSDNAVAAVGVVNQLIMFAFLIFEVINLGTSVLCSQYLGAKKQKNVVQVVGVAILLNLVLGLLVSAILHYGAPLLLTLMGLRPELMVYGVGYMARSVMERWVISCPLYRIWPDVGSARPMMTLAMVVLPPPLGPVKTTSFSSGMVMLMSLRMSCSPSGVDTR